MPKYSMSKQAMKRKFITFIVCFLVAFSTGYVLAMSSISNDLDNCESRIPIMDQGKYASAVLSCFKSNL